MPKLFLIRGMPGSGKSTLAKFLAKNHFEADQYFYSFDGNYEFDATKLFAAHMWCQNRTRDILLLGYDVAVSNTFTTNKELKPYFDIAAEIGIVPTVILCQNQFDNIHDVPQETLDRMKQRFTYDISSLFKKETND